MSPDSTGQSDERQRAQHIQTDELLQPLDSGKPPTVSDALDKYRRSNGPSADKSEFLARIRELQEEGRIRLELPKNEAQSYFRYVRLLDENTWLYLLLTISLLSPVLGFVDATFPYTLLRWFFGSLDVAFVPGYALLWILFPGRRQLNNVERLALSVIFSVAVVSLIGFALNLSPFGLALFPFAIVLTALNVVTIMAASFSRYKVISRSN